MIKAKSFPAASIKRKLMMAGLLTAGAALLSISVMLLARAWLEERGKMVDALATYAEVIATNAAPAMLFDDRRAAADTLAALKAIPDIVFAALYDNNGEFFAVYATHGKTKPIQLPSGGGYRFTTKELALSRTIPFKGKTLGTIYLQADLRHLYLNLLKDSALTFAAALLALLVAGLLFTRLQKGIVGPIRDLAALMQRLAGERNYAVRAPAYGNDEVGVLAQVFNTMLAQIQARDEALEAHRAHLEQEVAERTAKLTEAQRIAHLGNWEWDIAANTLEWSDEIYRIFGLAPRQFGATYQVFLDAVYPNDRAFVEARVREALDLGRPYSIDHRIVLPDGAVRYVHEQAEVSRNDDGQPVKMLGTVQDITEGKLAEEEIRKQQELTTQIIETIPLRVFWKDRELRYLGCNTLFAQDAGLIRPDELIGKTDFDMGWKDQAEIYRADDRRVVDSNIPKLSYDEPQTTPEGEQIWLRTSKVPLRNDVNGTIGVLGIYEDITEYKLAEEEIRKLNEKLETKVRERTKQLLNAQEELLRKEKLALLGQVAGSVGHELRNPLGVISNAVYFLRTVLAGSEDVVREYLDMIDNEVAGSERIVSDLLDSVRTRPPYPQLVRVRELLDATLPKCAIPKRIAVRINIPDVLPPIQVDALQMQQVLCNLLVNGADAIAGEGTLDVRAEEDRNAGKVRIDIKDSGAGITPENLSKLFQPLFTTKARGIGLGLVVVRNLIRANGGEVEVQSEVDKGTVFTLTLPSGGEV
jgi:PAS domain S-box-containing protein